MRAITDLERKRAGWGTHPALRRLWIHAWTADPAQRNPPPVATLGQLHRYGPHWLGLMTECPHHAAVALFVKSGQFRRLEHWSVGPTTHQEQHCPVLCRKGLTSMAPGPPSMEKSTGCRCYPLQGSPQQSLSCFLLRVRTRGCSPVHRPGSIRPRSPERAPA